MGKYFGTDGFRGEANVTLTAKHAFKIGRFLGWYYCSCRDNGSRARIVIGKDTRRSSYMLEYALAAGITSSGADAYLLHVTTTPSVALDCANGSAWSIAPSVFRALGAKVSIINAEPDGTNINRDAGSTHIEGLQRFVVENRCDVGFAYDGDADRCLCVDEHGEVVDGDKIMYIYARYLQERGKLVNNTVVATVMSNLGLFKALDQLGIGYAKTAVGDKNVYEYMAAHRNNIGGEQSGHIIFSKYASTGDGILTSLKMMEVMLAREKTLSELAAPVTIYPQVLENVRVTDKGMVMSAPLVKQAVEHAEALLQDSGRMLVRESGTEPLIRVMAEAADEETCRKCIRMVVDAIDACGFRAG